MPLFVDSLELVRAPGVSVMELAPPVIIEGQVIGYMGFVFQGEWGPDNVVTEPASTTEFMAMYFPPGSPHTSAGYYALMRRRGLALRPVRILKTGVAAYKTAAAGTGTYTATAKYKGTLGNSITVTWGTATDADAAHRDITVELTNSVTGTTREVYRNVVVAIDGTVDVSSSILLASFVFSHTADALPVAGTTVTLASGSEASITLTEYQAALDLLAARQDIFVVCTDDPGDSLRPTVNDALVDHVADTRSRLAVIQTNVQNAAWATVKSTINTHSPTYRSDRVVACGAWVYVQDDTGTERASPFATFVASALVSTEPQQSHAWWDDRITAKYAGISSLYAPFSTGDEGVQGDATDLGVCLPIRLDNGAYAALHDRTTSLTTGKRFITTRRIKDFLARSLRSGLRSFTNGINWRGRQLEMKGIVDEFINRQAPGVRPDEPRVVAWRTDIDSVNTSASVAQGRFNILLEGQTPSVMEKIGLVFNVGESVTVRET